VRSCPIPQTLIKTILKVEIPNCNIFHILPCPWLNACKNLIKVLANSREVHSKCFYDFCNALVILYKFFKSWKYRDPPMHKTCKIHLECPRVKHKMSQHLNCCFLKLLPSHWLLSKSGSGGIQSWMCIFIPIHSLGARERKVLQLDVPYFYMHSPYYNCCHSVCETSMPNTDFSLHEMDRQL